MSELFGTDGIRGVVNRELTADLAYRVGSAIGAILGGEPVIVGRDTRASGELLEAALCSGICTVGTDVWRVGILPTPGVAYLARTQPVGAAVVISASHNPAEYNGIKVFARGGVKVDDERQEQLEQLILGHHQHSRPQTGSGRSRDRHELADCYASYLIRCCPVRLDGIRAVVDCAHGAAYAIAPAVLSALGANVEAIASEPNGLNINEGCGSTDPRMLAARVREAGADCGLAYDGDADRCVAVDERGRVVDGDQILGIIALHRHARGKLRPPAVVVTVASNPGLERTLTAAGIEVHRSRVGDRFVSELMHQLDVSIGGEQSGHIIFRDLATTGDGILTSIQLLSLMQETGQSLSKLAAQIELWPQFSAAVPVLKSAVLEDEDIRATIDIAARALGGDGRVLVRPSGTEPVVRVLVQGRDERLVEALGRELVSVIARKQKDGTSGG